MNTKVCKICKIEKLLDEFYISKKDGHMYYCKDCNNKKTSQYYYNNIEVAREQRRIYQRRIRKERGNILNERTKQWRFKNKEYISKYNKIYKNTKDGKRRVLKSISGRRELGFVQIMDNPFPDEIKINWHHINNSLVIPLPEIVHKKNLGKEHKEKCNVWIQKFFCLDVNELINKQR